MVTAINGCGASEISNRTTANAASGLVNGARGAVNACYASANGAVATALGTTASINTRGSAGTRRPCHAAIRTGPFNPRIHPVCRSRGHIE